MRGIKYSPQTGMMYRNPAACSPARPYDVGPVINRDCHGYRRLVGKKQHRLAFKIMGQDIPKFVDHINGNRNDNRWCNLRPITLEANSRKRSDNVSGVNGVNKQRNRWLARYQHKGVRVYLGCFLTKEAAEQSIKEYIREVEARYTSTGLRD